ncbi:hypothetical protein PDESU_02502 [Pontiella desulfatans]|uniref:Rhamnogalacturonase A/B/Epimerase-like pectate lyase domain-containing protein n=1 Tax=Pontiella desulfatans TaxID=2750659 RepID=A0A6C2U243_PONDE|nr:glycosyl hydrolase family 28-related protein [Pontiella desulfatans]VGO13945.1 hypothetical protein PDESU_02502 [Pontiella desulfatans]
MSKTIIALLSLTITSFAAKPNWKVVHNPGPEQSPSVVGFAVQDFGAKGDGKTDDTVAFQQALDAMAKQGGGAVYAPAGHYAFHGHLTIPRNVTLRGDWADPTLNPEIKGTILNVYTDKGLEEGTAFISMLDGTGVKNLSIWYPEQVADKIVPYPAAIEQVPIEEWQGNNHCVTLENVTLVNPYQGFKSGPENLCLHYLRNVHGTPLKKGVFIHHCTDIGRMESVHFSPETWINSGLPGAPKFANKFRKWLLKNGTAIHIGRSDWEYAAFITIRGYNTGLFVNEINNMGGNSQFYALDISNCETAFYNEAANGIGYAFANCKLKGNQIGVKTGKRLGGPILMHDCTIAGGDHAIINAGRGRVALQHCTIEAGDITFSNGTLAMVDSELEDKDSAIRLEKGCTAATILGNRFNRRKPNIQFDSANENIVIDHEQMEFAKMPVLKRPPARGHKPAKNDLFVVDLPTDWKTDCTAKIQATLDKAGTNGGGIVFIPAGYYLLKGELTVPTGVELRGCAEVPTHSMSEGTTLMPVGNRGKADAAPAVALMEKSGIRGIHFYYPEQEWDNIKPYPFTIQSRGSDVYVIYVNGVNPYQFVDFKTYRSDRHFADYIGGAGIQVGIQIGGGSKDGVVAHTQFNTHYWLRSNHDAKFQPEVVKNTDKKWAGLWKYQKSNLDALAIGDCENELLFENFVYGSKYGLLYREENGRSPRNSLTIGHGTDGSRISLYVESANKEPISLINAKLVCMDHFGGDIKPDHVTNNKSYAWVGKEVKSGIQMFNTMMWGKPNYTARVDGGKLTLQVATYVRPGDGILVNGGALDMINNHMMRPTESTLNFETLNKPVRLIGSSMAEGFNINKKPRAEKSGTFENGNLHLKGVVINKDITKN